MEALKTQMLIYLGGTWRRRWICALAAWALCGAGWLGVALLPDRYEVESKVYIDTDSMMGPLLKGLTVVGDTDQQIQVMLRTLISRPNVEQVLRATDPRVANYSAPELERAVQTLTDAITIKPLGSKNLFSISVYSADSSHAEAVAQALLSLLMESSFGDKRRDMESAESFLDTKLSEYEGLLRQAEERVAQFKQQNEDYLAPGAANRLENAQTAATNAKQELDLAMTRRDSLRQQLANAPQTVASDSAVNVVISGNGQVASAGGSLANRIEQQRQLVTDMEGRYTDQHPDLIAARQLLAEMQRQLAAKGNAPAAGDAGHRMINNPVYEQLRLRLADEETNVALQQRRLEDAQIEIAAAKEVAQKVAEVTARAQDLDRDYDTIRKNYQELLTRRESARLTKAENERQQNFSFRVVEPPRKAELPVAPNRFLFNTIVLVLGLAGGIASGVVLTINQSGFSLREDLLEEFDLPVVGVVTALRRPRDIRRMQVSIMGLAMSVACLLVCYAGVLMLVKTSLHRGMGA